MTILWVSFFINLASRSSACSSSLLYFANVRGSPCPTLPLGDHDRPCPANGPHHTVWRVAGRMGKTRFTSTLSCFTSPESPPLGFHSSPNICTPDFKTDAEILICLCGSLCVSTPCAKRFRSHQVLLYSFRSVGLLRIIVFPTPNGVGTHNGFKLVMRALMRTPAPLTETPLSNVLPRDLSNMPHEV